MRPTRSGVVVLCVAAAATASGWLFGARALNAVVVPAAAAFVVAAALVHRADAPRVERDPPGDGSVGEERTVALTVEGSRAVVATVRDGLGDGLDGDATIRTALDGRTDRYRVAYRARGHTALGPATVIVTDPFGLWYRRFEAGGRDDVTVYPAVVALADLPSTLAGTVGTSTGRTEFAGLREYRHGDPLRDVNWRASAKRPDDYVVTTYEGDGTSGRLTVAVDVEADGDPDDAAVAAASLAVALLDAGVDVGLRTPTADLAPATGDAHRRRVLDALAGLGHGTVSRRARDDARVAVRATGDGVTVTVDEERRSFDGLARRAAP